MFARLLLLFIAVPMLELYLLFQLADATSPLFAFGLVIFTGIVGAYLVRLQGWQVFRRIETETRAGKVPTTAMADAGMILLAGGLLLTPGMLTDVFGFSLLAPPIRAVYRSLLTKYFRGRVNFQSVNVFGNRPAAGANDSNTVDGTVVHGETETPTTGDVIGGVINGDVVKEDG